MVYLPYASSGPFDAQRRGAQPHYTPRPLSLSLMFMCGV